jgi:RNA polymerase sigma-70 factor (ECF subfamily)
MTDGQLLNRYVHTREEAAFEAPVWRHGPMVLGVCRRILRDPHDAHDAFQATFLVLIRKAASVAPPAMLPNWLHGVARQTAVRARSVPAKRRLRERQVTHLPEPPARETAPWHDLRPLLDQELACLPSYYRAAVVLCDLEGKTHQQAARHLGWPVGTLVSRLSRGRRILAKRLTRRGLVLTGATLAALLSQNVSSAYLLTSLVSSTVQAGSPFGAGQAFGAGIISPTVIALARRGEQSAGFGIRGWGRRDRAEAAWPGGGRDQGQAGDH